MKGVTTIAAIAAFGVVSATGLAPTASADSDVSAIAYSPSTGVVGISWNYSTPEAAVARAVQECASNPLNPGDCRGLGGSMPPARCVAISIGPDKSQYAIAAGKTLAEAKPQAQNKNPGGAPAAYWTCNGKDQPPEQGASRAWPEP